jgi:hypothetical protein
MHIKIKYFDPNSPEVSVINGRNNTVYARNQQDINAHMANINDPMRGIIFDPGTDITELPEVDEPDLLEEFNSLRSAVLSLIDGNRPEPGVVQMLRGQELNAAESIKINQERTTADD